MKCSVVRAVMWMAVVALISASAVTAAMANSDTGQKMQNAAISTTAAAQTATFESSKTTFDAQIIGTPTAITATTIKKLEAAKAHEDGVSAAAIGKSNAVDNMAQFRWKTTVARIIMPLSTMAHLAV